MPEYFRPLKAVKRPAADPGSISTSDSRYLAQVVIRVCQATDQPSVTSAEPAVPICWTIASFKGASRGLRASHAERYFFWFSITANPHDQAADAWGCRSFAPMKMSHSMMASSPNITGKTQLETLCSYCGHNMPVTLVAR